MRRNIPLLIAAGALLLAGCYRVTVVTGAPPAPTAEIDRPWQHSFVYGIVPPSEINTNEQCPQGIATVQTERSFLNGLVSILTWSLYTPLHATVTCATGPVQGDGDREGEGEGAEP